MPAYALRATARQAGSAAPGAFQCQQSGFVVFEALIEPRACHAARVVAVREVADLLKQEFELRVECLELDAKLCFQRVHIVRR